MKLKYSHIVVVLTLLFLFSCTNEEEAVGPKAPAEKDNNGVWYLKRNATFRYTLTFYDTAGVLLSTGTVTNTIDNDSLIDNVTWYKMSDSPVHYYRNRPDGLYGMQVESGVVTGPYLLWKYPTALNDTYLSNGDSVLVENYVGSNLTNEATITYRFSKNGKKRSVLKITSGSCPSAITYYGLTHSGREYMVASMILKDAVWP